MSIKNNKTKTKNKYIVFISIGFELVTLILISIYTGEYLVKNGYSIHFKAGLIIAAFLVWFISLFLKLKSLENKQKNENQ